MAIPAGYNSMPSGFFMRNSDGSGPYAIDASGNAFLVGTRSPTIFKPLNTVSISSETAIWTPGANKKFRLQGYMLAVGGAGGNVILKDGTGGTTILIIPSLIINVAVVDQGIGNGLLSAAINNVLTATGAALQTLSGYVYGTEES